MAGPSPQGTPDGILVAQGMTNARDASMPMLIVRRRGRATVFAAAIQPLREGESAAEVAWVRNGPQGVVAVRLTRKGGEDLVVLNPTGRAVTIDGFASDTPLSSRHRTADGRTTSHVVR